MLCRRDLKLIKPSQSRRCRAPEGFALWKRVIHRSCASFPCIKPSPAAPRSLASNRSPLRQTTAANCVRPRALQTKLGCCTLSYTSPAFRRGNGSPEGLGGPKPAAPSGRNRQAERRESQGALARLCEFPEHPSIPLHPSGPSTARSLLESIQTLFQSISAAQCAARWNLKRDSFEIVSES